MPRSEYLSGTDRLYTKISGSLLIEGGKIDYNQFRDLSEELVQIYNDGVDIFHVSSGAINCGKYVLGIPMDQVLSESERRAVASVGQNMLMTLYTNHLSPVKPGQILISSDDLSESGRRNEILVVYDKMKGFGIIPIINNNDTVNSGEVRYSENDKLFADLVISIEDSRPLKKPLCVIMSENALREGPHPEATEIDYVEKVDNDIMGLAWDHDGNHTFGGMKPKLESIKIITEAGYPVVLADGKHSRAGPDILKRILEGENIGTFFEPQKGL